MSIRPSGRSTDFISPSFSYGCVFNCDYCYMKRHLMKGINIATNTHEILSEIDHHVWFAVVDKPNQTHEKYITYDIGCNEDFAAHYKYNEWHVIFDFFKNHELAFASFATKFVNREFLSYNPNRKVRIRFSLMPDKYSLMFEPGTSRIIDRIQAIDSYMDAGYDVHINFSPVIYTPDWEEEYTKLFHLIDELVEDDNKRQVKCEVIFLTHNKVRHAHNLLNNREGESLLWRPSLQEDKISQYGCENIRYKSAFKNNLIKRFIEIHDAIIPWNTIRYIF